MKLIEQFKTFLDEEVNLNQTRVDQLDSSVEAVQRAIKASSWGAKIVEFRGHGSWAHGTIIKPVSGDEFDADLLAIVEPVTGWTAAEYIDNLYNALKENSTYKDKVRRYSYCVTIEYAKERRIDIAPCVLGRQVNGIYEVCNRTTDTFKQTEPIRYTDWVKSKNGVAGGNDMKKVTRLLKHLRAIKTNFTCPSFLLTTLIGLRISDSDKDSKDFVDTPTCLKTIIGRLDDWLQANASLPTVRNPVLAPEVQSEVWDDTKYANFRDKINVYRGWIDDAYDEQDKEESIAKWRRVFGDAFAASETKAAARVSESITKRAAVAVYGQFKDLVDMVKARGKDVIPSSLVRLPHVRRPTWRAAPQQQQHTVRVSADLLTSRNGAFLRNIASGEPLPNHRGIRFKATNAVGVPFGDDYKLQWRVANTDTEALDAGQLRGEFNEGKTAESHNESLGFRGVHFVQAFLVKKSDRKIYGVSEPFYVVVE
ncbi:SMODS domain-containing nucleotidyltransferase [Scleromatobacter humisilvae]|uniref:Adenylyl/Guanylyl and SMODS C-terminal sensor domain-containing protein n=1 Tax=Scleromatobacter humisilvae TaxID=2897159 RepID=A0A9X1YFT8_9BURK|nr:hypothetical protein [Scleromatobacter humisilvae]MCK9685719.1 hypothetical protein [Scleromatobacter humisilvae]